ncbi:hypothetical protein [Allocoleopsis franciscana]|uniref:Uncharacterized protein n=1 Tax=Allocoleopsis franciscana PCC 7113 TaxID=1173027 RepID=K9WB07_9CYAN|nr:hypothetical protein [Allocoleopsis franciscana]AFZ16687.1 hypothetical protein Mic7113_0777 [Allocoleopsis franciscana PCC 7113]
MVLDLHKFYQATNPSKTLAVENAEDRKYYIDFSSVRGGLESIVRSQRNRLVLAITDDEWNLLRQVAKQKKVTGDQNYQTLIRSLFVHEYYDQEEPWFDINPILAEAKEFQL